MPEAFRRFVEAVLASPDLQRRLAAPLAADAFARSAGAIASSLGIPLDSAQLDAHLHARAGNDASTAPITLDRWPPAGWLPVRLTPAPGPEVDWLWFGERELDAPFYEDSVRQVRSLPFNRLMRVRTSLTTLTSARHDAESLPLGGMIFHMSRCGSTLAARMLARIPEHVVLSEPEPLDAVLQWTLQETIPHDDKVAAVRAVVAALGRRRSAGKARLFVKLDAWHTRHIELLRAAFPATPWIYLFRDPVEVMVSQMRSPGIHVVPGSAPGRLLGVDPDSSGGTEDYCARILAAIGREVLSNWQAGGDGAIIDYASLRAGGLERIAAHFGLPRDAAILDAVKTVTATHSKYLERQFHDDSQHKRASVDVKIEDSIANHLVDQHHQLELISYYNSVSTNV